MHYLAKLFKYFDVHIIELYLNRWQERISKSENQRTVTFVVWNLFARSLEIQVCKY